MAAPTSTYCDYATGNDYKGATFTDGAYTSATKTLVKLNAFTATKVNHWLYLESNDGGSIVAGYYKVATWTDASTVILATDAGAGVDDDAAKCTQADGTTTKPWRSIQGALDLMTKDTTNGDQINVKAGTAQVNQAALSFTVYGANAEGAPLVIRGYTSTAGDGGIGEIDCGGFQPFGAGARTDLYLYDLELHSFGNNIGIYPGARSNMYHCEVHKGASSPSSKQLVYSMVWVVGCYVHDAGTTGTGIASTYAFNNYVKDCPTGLNCFGAMNGNLVVDCTTYGIRADLDSIQIIGNSVYSSTAATGKGIGVTSTASGNAVLNNIVEGYSGSGGIGISAAADLGAIGYNAFYNNATNESLTDVLFDLGGDQTLTASPFVNPGAGDFSLNAAVAGAIETAWPGAWYGPASTTNKADMGAVQKGAGVSGPPGWL